MKTIFAVAAVLSIAAAIPTLSDFGRARAAYSRSGAFLAYSSEGGPSLGGHDTALAYSSEGGPSLGGHDTALAYSSEGGPSLGGRDTALAA